MFALTIKSTDEQVRKTVRATDAKLLPAMGNGLSRGLQSAAAITQREYLHGPRPERLGVVTTRLQNSIATEVKVSGSSVIGRIGSNVRYAAYHEFGFTGTENVKGFYRALTGAPGRSFRTEGGRAESANLSFGERPHEAIRRGRKIIGHEGDATRVGFVRAHTRQVKYPGKPFLRPALAASLPVIEREMKAELDALAKGEV